MIEWLHREKGFDVVAFESGFFECSDVNERISELAARQALYDCLRYPFQHRELLPLFEYIRATQNTDHPLQLAGVDIQSQGFDSESRPERVHAALAASDEELARQVARADSLLFLPPVSGGMDDQAFGWAFQNGDSLTTMYLQAASHIEGYLRWSMLLSVDLIARLSSRGASLAAGDPDRPAGYYLARDRGMARAIGALADSMSGSRKVVVYLHNDHARYQTFAAGSHRIPSAASLLRTTYGEELFSIGMFMGRGTIADNGRNIHMVIPPAPGSIEQFLSVSNTPFSFVILRDNENPGVAGWAGAPRAYNRMGIDPRELTPADEFDALIYADSVAPPHYDIP